MKLQMNPDTIAATTKCAKNFACLEDPAAVCCTVEQRAMHRLYFIQPDHDEPCPYRIKAGHGDVCMCPVRREIYDRYGI